MRHPQPLIGATAIALSALLLATAASAQPADPPAGERQSSIGYPSVAAALAALKARNDVKISDLGGWTVVEDGMTLWSFAPSDHPAYPSAVKRTLVEQNGAFYVRMNVLCQAAQSPCDKLVAEFQQLNEQMRQSIARSHPPRPPGN
jgi:hypothetical protein